MSRHLPVASPAAVRAAVLGDLRADRRAVVIIIVVNGLAAAAGLIGPWLLGRIIDTIQTGGGDVLGTVDQLALAAVLFTIVQAVLAWWALKVGYRFGERTAARVRERFLKRALALPARVADQLPLGDLIARGSTDASLVASTLRFAVPEVIVAVVHALFLIIAVIILNPLLGLCGLVCLVGVGTAVRWYLRRARPAYLAVAATGAELADVVASTAKGSRTVELLGLEQRRAETAEAAITSARSARLWALRLRSVLFPWSDVSLALPVVGVLVVGGGLYLGDLVSLGTVVTATVFLRQLVGPLDTLMLWIEQLQGAGASYARVEGLTGVTGVETRPGGPAKIIDGDSRGDRLRVENAHYSYTGVREVLRGVDLTVRPGERLAIVGMSGAGKSTLARLLAGLDRPHVGSVTIDGVPVADLSPEQLREHVVLITQDHHVFHDTVRDNLRMVSPDATDEDLRAALEAVGAGWYTDLPNGLDTELGRDLELDDAGAQQLSLARVVLADPHTVILDEATALLDPKTARRTEQSLAAVLHDRTVIAIAHRLQTAHDSDRIAVMEAGELVELGTHAELVSAGGVYGKLWRTWHAEPEDPPP
ncbi:ABC transporter ATP-binding protein [Microlunatus parietis]|uniref:ABC-type multidrug transport system fused ATPase/permease subunit n=1 Tax=Microlunatus parietis TaxID=682979 RepID=A0A7Y9L8E1_9ACTN|nr:ABC transporter ATP-binding protein [Microlunatus parietis]NYE70679.1 ABC-type multidrug transport system fused ATPase/permease subunit [Microlunatus parietis]